MKEPRCKICGGRHYAYQCWRRPREKKRSFKECSKPFKGQYDKKLVSDVNYSEKAVRGENKPIKRRKTSSSERKLLVQRLDRLASLYVRRKNSHCGKAQCYTCGKVDNWKNMDCGHSVPRRYIGTRWDLDGLRVQCVECNRYKRGNYQVFYPKLRRELGDIRYDELWMKARTISKIQVIELREKEEYFKKLLNSLVD